MYDKNFAIQTYNEKLLNNQLIDIILTKYKIIYLIYKLFLKKYKNYY